MPARAVFRWIIQALFVSERDLTPPRNLRAEFGAEASGSFPVTLRWDKPASWGDDAQGAGARGFGGGYKQLLNADGTAYSGRYQDYTPFTAGETRLDHVPPDAPRGTVWEFRVRAVNKNGEHSNYAHREYHAVEQDGFLLLDRRYLRVYDGSEYRRLRELH